MFLQAFSVFDTKVRAFMRPFFLQNEDVALRAVCDEINEPGSAVGKHPEDYILYRIGGFDDASGTLEVLVPPLSLGPLSRFKLFNALDGERHE